MLRTLIVPAAMMVLSACAQDLNLKNAARYHNAGLAAEHAGDYPGAEQAYYRALINFRDGGASESSLSMELYNLARMEGYDCKYDEAEAHLRTALEIEERLSGPSSSLTTKRLFELARLTYDRGRYTDSAAYYARAIPAVQQLGIEQEDPVTLAAALDEYATALRRTGQGEMANRATAEAGDVRARHPDARKKYNFVRYTQPCRN
jgi:tetratricopeptide (TPR) repeat protein